MVKTIGTRALAKLNGIWRMVPDVKAHKIERMKKAVRESSSNTPSVCPFTTLEINGNNKLLMRRNTTT
jgi:hypothetical protein